MCILFISYVSHIAHVPKVKLKRNKNETKSQGSRYLAPTFSCTSLMQIEFLNEWEMAAMICEYW